jgi:hypothetical protein
VSVFATLVRLHDSRTDRCSAASSYNTCVLCRSFCQWENLGIYRWQTVYSKSRLADGVQEEGNKDGGKKRA